MILATKEGWLIRVRILRETPSTISYSCVDEPGSEYTISKHDSNQKIFDNAEDAEAWILQ